MTCPHCERADGAHPLVRVSARVVTWLCGLCGLTFDVEE